MRIRTIMLTTQKNELICGLSDDNICNTCEQKRAHESLGVYGIDQEEALKVKDGL